MANTASSANNVLTIFPKYSLNNYLIMAKTAGHKNKILTEIFILKISFLILLK